MWGGHSPSTSLRAGLSAAFDFDLFVCGESVAQGGRVYELTSTKCDSKAVDMPALSEVEGSARLTRGSGDTQHYLPEILAFQQQAVGMRCLFQRQHVADDRE